MAGSQDIIEDPRNAAVKVWVNGALVPRDAAVVSVFDGGFIAGDGVWEGLRLIEGRLLFLDEHLDRLFAGARSGKAHQNAAVAAHPLIVAGRGRFDTEVMSLLGARAFTKSGAEGVFCAGLPESGLGLAVKADDGSGRAAQVMIATLIRRFGGLDDETAARFIRFVCIVCFVCVRRWS